jgi:hypothetical protein
MVALYLIHLYTRYRTDSPSKSERHISIRFPLDVLGLIRKLAKYHERSFNGVVIWALREYAERHKNEIGREGREGREKP